MIGAWRYRFLYNIVLIGRSLWNWTVLSIPGAFTDPGAVCMYDVENKKCWEDSQNYWGWCSTCFSGLQMGWCDAEHTQCNTYDRKRHVLLMWLWRYMLMILTFQLWSYQRQHLQKKFMNMSITMMANDLHEAIFKCFSNVLSTRRSSNVLQGSS